MGVCPLVTHGFASLTVTVVTNLLIGFLSLFCCQSITISLEVIISLTNFMV